MDPRTGSLLAGFAVGLVAGLLVGALAVGTLATPVTGTATPSHSLTTATGCASPDEPRPWIGSVPDPDHRSVYLANYSYAHAAADVDVRANLSERAPGAWVLAVTTSPGDAAKTPPDDCQPRTTVDAAVALPTDAESLAITVDGERIAAVRTATTAPRFRYLDG
jgi:hypothetical protein